MSTDPSADGAAEAGPPAGESLRGRLATGPLLGLLFALIGGGLAWVLLETFDPVFVLPKKYEFEMFPPPDLVDEVIAAEIKIHLGNRVFGCGLLGVILGTVLGLGEGMARRSLKTLILAGISCGLIGVIFGMAAGFLSHYVHADRVAAELRLSLSSTVIVQCALWTPFGAGVGLALGLWSGRLRTLAGCVVGGMAAGALAGAVYPVAASYLLPEFPTDWPVPLGGEIRALWIACPFVLLGLIVPFAARQETKGGTE